METYEGRLATFAASAASTSAAAGSRHPSKSRQKEQQQTRTQWPHSASFSVTPESLASAGFYYDPTAESAPDNVTCAYCKKGLEGWEDGDDALDEHLRRIDKGTGDKCSWATVMGAKRDWDLFGDGALADGTAQLDPAGEVLAQARRSTFGSWWKFDGKKGWKPTSERLAMAGFYNCPLPDAPDTCACIYCDVQLDGWSKNDDPETEHAQRTPDCYFFTSRQKKVLQQSKKASSKQNIRASLASNASSAAASTKSASTAKSSKSKSKQASRSNTSMSVLGSALHDVDENEEPAPAGVTVPAEVGRDETDDDDGVAESGPRGKKAAATRKAPAAPSTRQSKASAGASAATAPPKTRKGRTTTTANTVQVMDEQDAGSAIEVVEPLAKAPGRTAAKATARGNAASEAEAASESELPSRPPSVMGSTRVVAPKKAGKKAAPVPVVLKHASAADMAPSEQEEQEMAVPAEEIAEAKTRLPAAKSKAARRTTTAKGKKTRESNLAGDDSATGGVQEETAEGEAGLAAPADATTTEGLRSAVVLDATEDVSVVVPPKAKAKTTKSGTTRAKSTRRGTKASAVTATSDEGETSEGPSVSVVIVQPAKKSTRASTVSKPSKRAAKTAPAPIPVHIDSNDEAESVLVESETSAADTDAEEGQQPTPKAVSVASGKASASTGADRGTTKVGPSNGRSAKADVSIASASGAAVRTRSHSQSSVASSFSVSTSASHAASGSESDGVSNVEDAGALRKSTRTTRTRQGKSATQGKKATAEREVGAARKPSRKGKERAPDPLEPEDASEAEQSEHELDSRVPASSADESDADDRSETASNVDTETADTEEEEQASEAGDGADDLLSPERAHNIEPEATVRKPPPKPPVLEALPLPSPSLPAPAAERVVRALPKRKSSPQSLPDLPVASKSKQQAVFAPYQPPAPSESQTGPSRSQSALDALLAGPIPTFDSPEKAGTGQMDLAFDQPLTEEEAAMPVQEWVKLVAERQLQRFQLESAELIRAWDKRVAAGRQELVALMEESA